MNNSLIFSSIPLSPVFAFAGSREPLDSKKCDLKVMYSYTDTFFGGLPVVEVPAKDR